MSLSEGELSLYARTLALSEIGVGGQRKLKAASVLIVGVGGLGSPMSIYLAVNGVGRIGVLDFDVVEPSNLQRQIVHEKAAVGETKVGSAAARLRAINPHIEVRAHDVRLARENALEILRDYDLIADGSDNFATRYLVNDACVRLGKINVHASLFRYEGQVTVFDPARGPCYRCLYAEPTPESLVPSASDAGVFGMLAGAVGMLQATAVVNTILGLGEPLVGRLLLYDAINVRLREVKTRKDPRCAACGPDATISSAL